MKRILIISKFLAYQAGGAERSTINLLKKKHQQGDKIFAICARIKGEKSKKADLSFCEQVKQFDLTSPFKQFRYIEYFFIKDFLAKEIENFAYDEIWVYDLWAPCVKNASGHKTYFPRDIYGCGLFYKNYSKNIITNFFKFFYYLLNTPFFLIWKNDFKKIIMEANIVCNSNFIKSEILKLSPSLEATVEYPLLDIPHLEEIKNFRKKSQKKYITLVGATAVKGHDIVQSLASKFPFETFQVFDDRNIVKEPVAKNIKYIYFKGIKEIYQNSKIVIIPSQWPEAYSRVAAEAKFLDIPTIASLTGGIPEACSEKAILVEDFTNLADWENKLNRLLEKLA